MTLSVFPCFVGALAVLLLLSGLAPWHPASNEEALTPAPSSGLLVPPGVCVLTDRMSLRRLGGSLALPNSLSRCCRSPGGSTLT
jgi:hypothetical protein